MVQSNREGNIKYLKFSEVKPWHVGNWVVVEGTEKEVSGFLLAREVELYSEEVGQGYGYVETGRRFEATILRFEGGALMRQDKQVKTETENERD